MVDSPANPDRIFYENMAAQANMMAIQREMEAANQWAQMWSGTSPNLSSQANLQQAIASQVFGGTPSSNDTTVSAQVTQMTTQHARDIGS